MLEGLAQNSQQGQWFQIRQIWLSGRQFNSGWSRVRQGFSRVCSPSLCHAKNLLTHPVGVWSVSWRVAALQLLTAVNVYTQVCWCREKFTSLGRFWFLIFKRNIWAIWSYTSFQLINHVISCIFREVSCKRTQWHSYVLMTGFTTEQGVLVDPVKWWNNKKQHFCVKIELRNNLVKSPYWSDEEIWGPKNLGTHLD